MTYKSEFRQRHEKHGQLGEMAENAFLQWAETKNVEVDRYGFDNSKIKRFWKLPMKLRKTPDFICYGTRPFFCEAKGTGRRRYTSVKYEDLEGLLEWQKELDVWLFFYDSHRSQVSFNDLMTIVEISKTSKTGYWDGAKPYYMIPDDAVEWEPITIVEKEEVIGY